MPRSANGLSPLQQAFLDAYLIEPNATKAAIAAGYAKKDAKVTGCRLLKKPRILAALHAAQDARAERTGITADRVLEELARIAFADMRKFTAWGPDGVSLSPSDELAPDDARCVAEVSQTVTKEGGSLRFKLHDKKGALELLGKHLGLFPDRVAIEDPSKMSSDELRARAGELRRRLRLGAGG